MSHPESSDRIFGLDLMRAIAILLVVYMHGAFLLPDSILWLYNLPVPAIDGVAIFFALSGFLIGGILLKQIERPQFGFAEIKHFWIRRWFRTLPAYWLVLLIILLVMWLLGQPFTFFTWKFFVFAQNLYSRHPRFFPEAWSLAVEEWFYLLLPLMIAAAALLMRDRKRALVTVATIMLIVPVVLRLIGYDPAEIALDNRYVMFFTKIVMFRFDAIMYGVLMAYLFRYHQAWCLRWKWVGLIAGIAMIVGMTAEMRLGGNSDAYRAIWLPSLEPLAAMLTIPFLASWQTTRFKWLQRPIELVSTISYSMYLLNLTLVQKLIIPYFTGEVSWKIQPSIVTGCTRLLLFYGLTFGLAYLLYRFWERPMRDLRERFKAPDANRQPKQ